MLCNKIILPSTDAAKPHPNLYFPITTHSFPPTALTTSSDSVRAVNSPPTSDMARYISSESHMNIPPDDPLIHYSSSISMPSTPLVPVASSDPLSSSSDYAPLEGSFPLSGLLPSSVPESHSSLVNPSPYYIPNASLLSPSSNADDIHYVHNSTLHERNVGSTPFNYSDNHCQSPVIGEARLTDFSPLKSFSSLDFGGTESFNESKELCREVTQETVTKIGSRPYKLHDEESSAKDTLDESSTSR